MTTENVTIQDLLTALLYWRSKAKEYDVDQYAEHKENLRLHGEVYDLRRQNEEAYNIGYVNGRKDAEADQWSEATRE